MLLFFEKHVRHVKGAQWYGKPFKLLEWQVEDVIKPLFGWKVVDPDLPESEWLRRYRKVYVEIPKKQGKSALTSGLGLWFLTADGEKGAEVYAVAGDTMQARIVFDDARKMAGMDKTLSRITKPYQYSILHQDSGSMFRVLSADAHTKHGYSPSAILFDELHVQPNRHLWDTLVQGIAARRQPVVFAITTAGWYDPNAICWEQHDYALKVRDGIIKDDSFLPVIYAADKDEDWTDPDVWVKANPSLGVTVQRDFYEKEVREAKEIPAKENTFRRLHLNQWTEQETRWLSLDVWDENGGIVSEDSLFGMECYGGLDLASTTDVAALALVFPDDGQIVMRFWIPEDNMRRRVERDRVPYDLSLIHISEPTRQPATSRMPSSA